MACQCRYKPWRQRELIPKNAQMIRGLQESGRNNHVLVPGQISALYARLRAGSEAAGSDLD